MKRSMRWAAASAMVLAGLAGCAATRPSQTAVPQPPAATSTAGADAGTLVGSTASGGSITIHQPAGSAPAVTDSTPSPEALAVLGTIPEPLGGAPAAEGTSIPVPAPTEPLGDRARTTATLPDSPVPPPASGAATVPAAAAPAKTSVSPDSCWRVQVAAPPDREHAQRMVQAAESQLGLPFVIEQEAGLYKVRTRECLSATAATALRNRAVADGLDGSFRFLRPKS